MRIIVVNDYGFVNGGASQVAISSINSLVDAGHEVVFFFAVGPLDKSIDPSRVKVIGGDGYDLLGNPSKIAAMVGGIWSFKYSRRLGLILDECNHKETIVHIHGWSKALSSSIIRICQQKKIKYVVTLHDYISVCPNGGLYNYRLREHCTLKPLSFSCVIKNCDSRSYFHKAWRILRGAIQYKFARLPNYNQNFIFVSSYSKKILNKYISSPFFYGVQNPIDVHRSLLKFNIPPNNLFVFVGRISAEKGAELFANASSIANVEFAFIGDGPQKNEINEAFPRAKMFGWCDREEVLRLLAASKALILPSVWHETQGMVVLEAAAMGVPSIVSDSCAAADLIIDGQTGLLFRSGDVLDLAAKILTLNTNINLCKELGRNAFERYWAEPATINKHIDGLINCYTDILEKSEYENSNSS